jgi:hypothetical protein
LPNLDIGRDHFELPLTDGFLGRGSGPTPKSFKYRSRPSINLPTISFQAQINMAQTLFPSSLITPEIQTLLPEGYVFRPLQRND